MKRLYALVPVVAALLLVQAVDVEKKGSFDLEFTGSTSVEHTKIPPESVKLTDVELFGHHLTPEHTKLPPEGSAATFPLA